MSSGQIAWEQIAAARQYSLNLLAGVDDQDWFRQPTEGVTHIAWQVGHLASAQYMLCLARARGERPDDMNLLPANMLPLFLRGSAPEPDSGKYPTPQELLATLARVHAAAQAEVAQRTDEELRQPALGKPHPLFTDKLGALFWCARHEMLHAGQIGLLKRLLGHPPKW